METQETPTPTPKPKPITITSLSYGMTVALPAYENVKFELTAQVTLDEDWREVLDSLRRKAAKIKERIQNDGG